MLNQKKTDPVQYFYYSKVLKRNLNGTGETTVPLFTKVWVDKKVNNRRQTWIQEMGGVEITDFRTDSSADDRRRIFWS